MSEGLVLVVDDEPQILRALTTSLRGAGYDVVTAGQVGNRVLIAVVDEGPGIPRGTESQLFAPFQRLGDQDNTIGVGLGLSVARGFVEAMGGTISTTDTPGGGLTVEIDLAAAS